MPKVKRMAGGGRVRPLSDEEGGARLGVELQEATDDSREANRSGYAARTMRGLGKTQLQSKDAAKRYIAASSALGTGEADREDYDTKRNASRNLRYKELEDALSRGEDASLFMDEIIRNRGGMKSHKAEQYKKGGLIKMASGGRVRGDGCAIKGKTKGRIV